MSPVRLGHLQFQQADFTAIKSISQRNLAIQWRRTANGGRLPAFEQYQPTSRTHDPNWLVIWNVEGSGTDRVFRALFQGKFIATGFRSGWEGKSMEDVVPPPLRAPALAAANCCVEHRRAIFMIYSTTDQQGRRVDGERLLLPFGTPETGVRQIIASTEPISLDGELRLQIVLDDFVARTTISYAGWLEASAAPAIRQTPSGATMSEV